METSLRYDGDSKSLRIHAKEKVPVTDNAFLQFQGELDTKFGVPTYLNTMFRYLIPNLSATFGLGVQYSKPNKIQYVLRGKKVFPVTSDGMLNFTIKGRSNMTEDLDKINTGGAAEFVWSIFNVKQGQDLRLKVGYDILDQIPYVQIRENNWTINADSRRWNIRYDL